MTAFHHYYSHIMSTLVLTGIKGPDTRLFKAEQGCCVSDQNFLMVFLLIVIANKDDSLPRFMGVVPVILIMHFLR